MNKRGMSPSYTFKKSGNHISQRRDIVNYLRENSTVKGWATASVHTQQKAAAVGRCSS
jgi:hypothetical protein